MTALSLLQFLHVWARLPQQVYHSRLMLPHAGPKNGCAQHIQPTSHQHRPQHATQLACRYVKFDTYHPAVSKGLPITRVISRTLLQKILAEAAMELAGEDVISNGVHVVRYEDVRPGSPCLPYLCVTVRQHTGQAAAAQQTADREPTCLRPRFDWARWLQVKVGGKDQVAAVTADGQKITGDILIGADGIRSKVGCPTSRFNTCHAGRR